ncbi:MAG: KH domain-containing protein [Cyanobacteria bacterium J06649_11]
MAFERLNIPKIYHPFICGPDNEKAKEIANTTGARINIPPASVEKDEMTVAGEKESVQKAVKIIMEIYKEKEKRTKTVSVEVTNLLFDRVFISFNHCKKMVNNWIGVDSSLG